MIPSSNLLFSLIACAMTIGTSAALAASDDSGKTISTQMLKCLKLPTDAPKTYSLTTVAILRNGIADFVAINFRIKPTEWEKAAAAVVAEAVTQCDPYGSLSGRFEFAVTPELIEAGPKN